MAANVLYDNNNHLVLTYTDLVTGDGIQTNQLIIINNGHCAIFDPGGDLTYMPLSMAVSKYIKVKDIDYIIATHQDPDIVSSLDKWLLYSDAKVIISRLWDRFIPHLVPGYMKEKGKGRIIAIEDAGANIYLGNVQIKALPAHFLHSVGNLHFYDCTSKILFSGDVGASEGYEDASIPVTNFKEHIRSMEGFHRRYMVSNKVCRLWVNMVRSLDISMIVPQHGRPFKDPEVIKAFLEWFANLECGIDNLTQRQYAVP